jgi:hypothetical protein
VQIISTLIAALAFGGTFWASIKLFDRYNSRNTFGLAALLGVVFAFSAPSSLFLLPLIAMLYLLVSYYDLGLFKSFAVVGSMFAMNVALAVGLHRLAATLQTSAL